MREPSPVSISVVIPCYQEAERVAAAVNGYFACVQGLGLESELILVDDGSTDRTAENAQVLIEGRPDLHCLTLEHGGKGAALKAGIEAASGKWILLADADWSMSPDQARGLVPRTTGLELEETPGIWIGCREHSESTRVGEPFYRHLLGRCFNHLVRLLLVRGVSDTQCGFKGFSAKTGKVFCHMSEECGWAFDVEFLLLAQRFSQPIQAVPIRWVYDPDSRIVPLRDSVLMGWALLRIGFRHGFRFGPQRQARPMPEESQIQEIPLGSRTQP